MKQFARARLTLAHHPWIYWLAVTAGAAAVGIGVMQAMAAVDAARRSWGEQATVWIASAEIYPGDPVAARAREVPRAVVPASAVTDDPTGGIARQRLGPGEIITVADATADGRAGLIPDGWMAFAIPVVVQHFMVGDHVGVYSGDRLLADGLAIERTDSDLLVAVPADVAPALATGLLADAVTVGLSRGP